MKPSNLEELRRSFTVQAAGLVLPEKVIAAARLCFSFSLCEPLQILYCDIFTAITPT